MDVTGCETITEDQCGDDAECFAGDADRDVADYVADASREHGLEDAIGAADDALADSDYLAARSETPPPQLPSVG